MDNSLKMNPKQIVIAVSELTEDILNAEQARAMVQEASYQIITGYLESSSEFHIDEILIALLPLSAKRLIDICLPFICPSPNGENQKMLARYIMMGNKLKGIRIRCTREWPINRCEHRPPPPQIQRYYRANNIPFEQNEVYVGCFCLQLIRSRIGLLFENEIIQNSSLLDIPRKYSYDIVSITADQPQPDSKGLTYAQKEVHSKLKKLGQDCLATVIFAGIRIIPTLNNFYNERTFIVQSKVVDQHKAYLGEPSSTKFLCNIDLTLNKRIQCQKNNNSWNLCQQELIQGLYIKDSLRLIKKFTEQKNNIVANKEYLDDDIGDNEHLLNLWYNYKTVHRGSPFVIPYPFTDRAKQLYSQLLQLETYALTKMESLIKLYRYKLGESDVKLQQKVYSDFTQMVQENTATFPNLIYVYVDDEEEFRALRRNQKYGSRVCKCDSINPRPKILAHRAQGLQSNIQLRKVEQACNHVLKQRMTKIDDILAYFRDSNFSKPQIEYCFIQELPKKIRRQIRPMNIHLFLIHSPKDKIIKEIEQSELRLSDGRYRVADGEEHESKNFRERVERTINYKRKFINNVKCHLCEVSLSKGMMHGCTKCKQWICYECIDILTKKTLSSIDDYKCLICSKICQCHKCKGTENFQPLEINQPIQKRLNDPQNNMCSLCQILEQKPRVVNFECAQCKKSRCYICYQRERGSKHVEESSLRICKNCQQFNQSCQFKLNESIESSIIMEEQPQPMEIKAPRIVEAIDKTEVLRQQRPLVLQQKEPLFVEKQKQQFLVKKEKDTLVNKSPSKEDQSKRLIEVTPQNNLKKKSSKPSSSSSSFKDSSSSSSSSSRKYKTKKMKSKSRSRSRSRKRHKVTDKKKKKEKTSHSKDKKQKQLQLQRTPSKKSQNNQIPLWQKGSDVDARQNNENKPRNQDNQSQRNTNQRHDEHRNSNRYSYQSNNYRSSNNRNQFDNRNRDNNDNRNRSNKYEGNRNKDTANNNERNTIIPTDEVDYEQHSY